MTGKTMSPATRLKLSLALKGLHKGKPRPIGAGIPSKQVVCLNDGLIYNSIHAAARFYNLYQQSVSACCNNKQKFTKDKYFQFIKVNENDDTKEI
jgi:hypothetical protein